MSEFILKNIDKGSSTEITRELYQLNQKGISDWLQSKKIITKTEFLLSFEDVTPWTRTGGETYGSSFKFSTSSQTKHIFIKAIVTISPEKSLKDWERRRNILDKNGIPVSNWYYHGGAIIFEDFYPLQARDIDFLKILPIGYKLDQLGFTTLKFLDDIRADRMGNPYFVDFGFDLGEPSESAKSSSKDYLLLKFPHKSKEISNYYK